MTYYISLGRKSWIGEKIIAEDYPNYEQAFIAARRISKNVITSDETDYINHTIPEIRKFCTLNETVVLNIYDADWVKQPVLGDNRSGSISYTPIPLRA